MKIVILSTFPPALCGIGQYAEQQGKFFEAEGHAVQRIDLSGQLAEGGWGIGVNRRFRQLTHQLKAADKIYVHYQSSLYHDTSWKVPPLRRLVPHLLLGYLSLRFRKTLEIIVHEFGSKAYSSITGFLQSSAAVLLFRLAPYLHFHTQHERSQFAQVYFDKRKAGVLSPNTFYRRRSQLNPADARVLLSIPKDQRVFLCTGFFHRGKGFGQFADLFQTLHARNLISPTDQLYIVTCVKPGDSQNRALLESLMTRVQSCPFIHVINRYLGDDEFDHWIVASDYVVSPYLHGFTSSIAARASLYKKPCILSAVGGLPEQASDRDYVYSSLAELETILTSKLAEERVPCM